VGQWTVHRILPKLDGVHFIDNLYMTKSSYLAGQYYDTTNLFTSPTQAFFLESPTSDNIVLVPRISGYDACQAQGLNDSKEMIGTCYSSITGAQIAFSWSSARGVKRLPGSTGCTQDWPTTIREDGTIAVRSSQCSDGSIHNYIVKPDGSVDEVPNYCTRPGEFFGVTTLGDDGTLGGFCQGIQNQGIDHIQYTNAVFVSNRGAITYIPKSPSPFVSTAVKGFFAASGGILPNASAGASPTGVGTYNGPGGFIFVGSTPYDFSRVFLNTNITSVVSSNANGQVVGQAQVNIPGTNTVQSTPAYLGTPIPVSTQ
jgi:hypothetical protein